MWNVRNVNVEIMLYNFVPLNLSFISIVIFFLSEKIIYWKFFLSLRVYAVLKFK